MFEIDIIDNITPLARQLLPSNRIQRLMWEDYGEHYRKVAKTVWRHKGL